MLRRAVAAIVLVAATFAATVGCRGGLLSRERDGSPPAGLASGPAPAPASTVTPAPAPTAFAAVPDVLDRPLADAASALHAAGFSVSFVRVRGAPRDVVLAQDPVAALVVPRGRRVTLRVADGEGAADDAHAAPGFAPPPGFTSPRGSPTVVGAGPLPSIDAPEALALLGSEAGDDDAVPAGVVPPDAPRVDPPLAPLAATPTPVPDSAPPFVLPPSAGVATADGVAVPSFLDRTRAQAQRIADDAGLALREEATTHGVPGRVMDQDPPSGTRVAAGATVVVRVAQDEPPPVVVAPPPSPAPSPAPLPAPPPAPVVSPPPAPVADTVRVPSVLDRTPLVARRLLEDSGLRVREETATRGVPGRVMDQMPLPGDDVPRGTEVVLRIPGWEPVIAPTPPASEIGAPEAPQAPEPPPPPVEPSPPPVEPPPPVPAPSPVPTPVIDPLGVPTPTSPADGSVLARVPGPDGTVSKVVRADLTWTPVAGADGYLVEVEESVDGVWTPILRRVVREARVSVEIEPAGAGAWYRWRVRSVSGRRGGAAGAWRTARAP